MGLLKAFTSLFSSKSVDFGKIDPEDLEARWRVELELAQAQRDGESQLASALQKYGLRDMNHWEKVVDALTEKHHTNPDFMAANARVNAEYQQKLMNAAMKGPPPSA